MSRTFFTWLGSLTLSLCTFVAAPAQEQIAIKGGKIIPVSSPPIDGGVVLIRDGKISAVGKDVAIPADYRVIDATGKVVLPGFIEAHSSRGMDQSNERNNNVPFLSVLDAIDPGQEYFDDCRRNGVTTVAIVPGNDTMIGGQAAIIKTAGTYVEQMIVKRQAGIKISLRPTTGRSRMSHLASLRKELDAARDLVKEERSKTKAAAVEKKLEPAGKPAEKEKGPSPQPLAPVGERGRGEGDDLTQQPGANDNPDPNQGGMQDVPVRREALVKLLKGEVAAFIYCDAALDVPQAIKLTKEYGLKTILVLGQHCYKAAKQVAASQLPVILEPTLIFWETDPRTGEDRKIVLPKVYREAGVPVTFEVTGIAAGNLARAPELPPTLGTNYLWFQAATAMKYGTSEAEALESITLRPAKQLGMDTLTGSIEKGKDADLVILTGAPLKITTWVDTTLVRGKVVYERSKDRKLQHLLQTSPQTTSK